MKLVTNAADRKDVVKVMEAFANEKAKYQGPPSFAYQIGSNIVDREGNVEVKNEAQAEEIKKKLVQEGLAEGKTEALNIDIPLTDHTAESLKNLIYMIHSKQYLIGQSVGKTTLKVSDRLVERLQTEQTDTASDVIRMIGEEETVGIAFTEDRIRFFDFPALPETSIAYCTLLAMMCKAAIEQKRVQPTETIEENEKYYMRVWLVRLGLDGTGGKETRRILLSNLKGHTAFRTEEDRQKWIAKNGGTKRTHIEE